MFVRFMTVVSVFVFFSLNAFSEEKNIQKLIDLASEATSAAQSGEYVIKTHYQRFDVPPPPLSKSVLENIPESVLKRNPDMREQMIKKHRERVESTRGLFAKDRTGIFRIVFDGDKQRIQREVGDRVTVYCTPYEKMEHSFFFASRPSGVHKMPPEIPGISPPPSERLTLYNKKDFDGLRRKGISEDTTIPNVKTLGYFADNIYFQTWFVDIRKFLELRVRAVSQNESPGLIIAQEEFKDCSCVKITLTEEIRDLHGLPTPSKTNEQGERVNLTESEIKEYLKKRDARSVVEVYLDPGKKYAVRRMVRFDSVIKVRSVLENEMKQDPESGVWYPSHWVYEQYRYDQLQVREENTMEVISINKKIDPKRFTLESVEGLKPGTPVIWKLDTPPPGKGKLEWDGKKIFAHGEHGENLVFRGIDPKRQRMKRIFFICGNLAIISGSLGLYYQYKNRRNRSSS